MKILFIIFVFIGLLPAFASLSNLTVQGIVVSYNNKQIVLRQDNGRTTQVPRTAVPKHILLRSGQKVKAVISSAHLVKLLKRQKQLEAKKTNSLKSNQAKKSKK